MGNTSSNKFSSKNLAEKLDSEHAEKCICRRYIAQVRKLQPPSLIRDSLNLLGIVPQSYQSDTIARVSGDWKFCRDFVVGEITKYAPEIESEKLSEHLDSFGWVEAKKSPVIRGEIIRSNDFYVELCIDRPDLGKYEFIKLGPFDINQDNRTVISYLTQVFNEKREEWAELIDVSVLINNFNHEEKINDIISSGYISGIEIDPKTYYKLSIVYQTE